MAKIAQGAEGAGWLSFMTLTTVPGSTWPEIMSSFSTLVRRMRQSTALEYAAVKETGQGGMKHLHVLLKGVAWVSQAWLSTTWKALTGAWNVDIRRCSGKKPVGYMAKYMAKGLEMIGGTLKKLITFSKGWAEKVARPEVYVVYYAGPPEPRAWEAIEDDGSLVERGCNCLQIGGNRGEHVSGKGYRPCQGT